MEINSWLVCGIAISNNIYPPKESCWKHPDLVNVPDILRYTRDVDEKSGAQIYENGIGVVVVLMPYAYFDCYEKLSEDYYKDYESIYSQQYATAVSIINRIALPENQITDFDWVMPIMEGERDFQEDYCCLSGIGTDSKEFVGLIDCSIIYTSFRHMANFVRDICNQKKLTKFQRWQLAYYQMAMQAIEAPKVYLTNKEEITIYTKLYECWRIKDNMEVLINNTNQAVSLFSFLSSSESSEDNSLFSSFLTFFGIIVGLEAIYNLLIAIFSDAAHLDVFKIVFSVFIVLAVVIFGVILFRGIRKKYHENKEFKEKTGRKRR